MDKYEYKVKADEIKALIAQKKYTDAVKIADSIDWTRVRSILMLCTISDLYKINRRLEESRDILLMAYERNPNGRTIVYSLCELSIKLGEVVQAVEYYKEYVQLAPKDTGRYILQYKLYEAQEVSLEERIAVLEEFKKRDYREKWAYELAYLYHRVGLATRCVEECDDLILWFGEGKYVLKAMELKMLHQPLTGVQQKRYSLMKGLEPAEEENGEEQGYETQEYSQEHQGEEADMDIQIRPMRMGQYDTINLQKELAENMKEFLLEEQDPAQETGSTALEEIRYEEETPLFEEEDQEAGSMTQEIVAKLFENTGEIKQITPPMEEEYYPEEEYGEEYPEEEYGQDELYPEEEYTEEYSEEYSEEYPEEEYTQEEEYPAQEYEQDEEYPEEEYGQEEEYPEEDDGVKKPVFSVVKNEAEPQAEEIFFEDRTEEMPSVLQEELDPEIARMLSQEYDGQISLVVPEAEKVEKQITGQISIEDVLVEWEKMKRANEQKRAEDVRKRVIEQTGAMFSEFDAATRNGILEQLEEAARKQEAGVRLSEAGEPDEEESEELYAEEVGTEAGDELYAEGTGTEDEEEFPEEEAAEEDLPEAEASPDDEETEEPPAEEDLAEEDSAETAPAESETESETESEIDSAIKSDTKKVHPAAKQKTESPSEEGSGRAMTEEETQAFSGYIQTKQEKAQIVNAIDSISLAPCTGNVIITGDGGADTVELAKELIKQVQQSDSNFSGKVAKISGKAMNSKDVETTLGRIPNGALIIEKAGDLKPETLKTLNKVLEKDRGGLIILMEDVRKAIDHMLEGFPDIQKNFNARIDIEALSNDALVDYGRKYAVSMEYTLDDLSQLALYTRIADMQTSEHTVTTADVKEIIDEAIESANRKNIGHFKDLLLAKRYDEEDMIILREKDFISY